MKIRVSIPGAYMAMEMDEEKAYKTFYKLMELLSISGAGGAKGTGEAIAELDRETKPAPVPEAGEVFVLSEPEVDETAIDVLEDTEIEPEEPAEPYVSTGYGGFLHIRCPDCGKVKGFCIKTRLHNYRCDCGSVTRLQDLVPLYMNCECGWKSRYLTNRKEPLFDINCCDCGNPVPVAWNPKRKQYETIRG